MIICPHCHFHNPTEHKFCQSCGAPLQIWRALLLPGASSVALIVDPQAEASESSPSASDDADIWQQVAANQA
ncbi:MAG: zinc ribbon domain-containing protein, partial [Cyanobacteria bacterium J06607_17]